MARRASDRHHRPRRGQAGTCSASGVKRAAAGLILLAAAACGRLPEHIPLDDPRLKPMLEAMTLVDRQTLGFTPRSNDSNVRVEWARDRNYDVMLHINAKTTRTVSFARTAHGYRWIGEQENFQGPQWYTTVDGTMKEQITITYDTVRISGAPLNTVWITYFGEDSSLLAARNISLDAVRPWLRKWGY